MSPIVISSSAFRWVRTQELRDLAAKDRQFGFDYVPNDSVVHLRVAVNQNISERDDAVVLGNPGHDGLIKARKLCEGLADNLELALHRRPKQRVGAIVFESFPGNKFGDQRCCALNVEEVFLRFKPHRGASWFALPIAESTDS